MIRKDKKYKDDNDFVSLTESRNEVGEICGKAGRDQMAECCFYGNFVEGLRQTIEDHFSEVSEGKGQ